MFHVIVYYNDPDDLVRAKSERRSTEDYTVADHPTPGMLLTYSEIHVQ